MAIKGNTGIDFLYRDIGKTLMPEEKGWPEVILHDKMIFQEKEFSVKEVVDATLQVLNNRLNSELVKFTMIKEKAPIFETELETKGVSKRIVLIHNEKPIAVSAWTPFISDITLRHKNVEYKQSGHMGKVFLRRL